MEKRNCQSKSSLKQKKSSAKTQKSAMNITNLIATDNPQPKEMITPLMKELKELKLTGDMPYYRKIQELADNELKINPALTQVQLCKKISKSTHISHIVIEYILRFINRYDSYCQKGEILNIEVMDCLVNKKISPHGLSDATACLITSNDENKQLLIDGKLSLKAFFERAREVNRNKYQGDKRSFEEINAEIRDINFKPDLHLSTSAMIFSTALDTLEVTIDRLISDDYLATFNEKDDKSRRIIVENCNRLERIKNVILSLV